MDFHKECINTAVIKNEEFLTLLNRYSDLIQSIKDVNKVAIKCKNKKMEDYVSEEYRNSIIEMGRGHEGFPEVLKGFNIDTGFESEDPEETERIVRKYNSINVDLENFIGCRNRALSSGYPPGGFISWHNNANASGYNIILTWSEKGDGAWEHVDPKTKERVVIPDVKGWQCKYGYYGRYDDDDKVLYHCAYTNCLRMTIAFVFNRDETGKNMAQMLIEEITSE